MEQRMEHPYEPGSTPLGRAGKEGAAPAATQQDTQAKGRRGFERKHI